jgi:hypothetical protein
VSSSPLEDRSSLLRREGVVAAETSFYESVIGAGAILSGFCGTFLSFRIQREANYYRQPAVSFEHREARDVFVGLTHFTSAFLLLILASLCSVIFGFLVPLFALAGLPCAQNRVGAVVAGLVAALVLIGAYFFDELVHYRILSVRLLNDAREWGSEIVIVLGGLGAALIAALWVLHRVS